jgi:hypothetical protein
LNTGITFASLNLSGTNPVKMDSLKIVSRGVAITLLSNFNTEIGMLKGLVDLFVFKDIISFSISNDVIGCIKKLSR